MRARWRLVVSALAIWLSAGRTLRTAHHVKLHGYDGAPRALVYRMCEFSSLDRCAAYVAARAALVAVQRASAGWPDTLADRARSAAIDTLHVTAEAISHAHGSAGRRRCLRDAITSAIRVAASIDVARAMGCGDAELDDVQRLAGRTVALLGMFLHANTSPFADDVQAIRCEARTVT